MKPINILSALLLTPVLCGRLIAAATPVDIPESAQNLLVGAKVSGNLESYKKGLRGGPDHMIYDLQRADFVKSSQWHEYGVGFGQDLGVVAEHKPVWWMAEWPRPVEANLIVLSGVYPNQPQPNTAWKIELRQRGRWTIYAQGIDGWYDRGRYTWGGPGTTAVRFDAIRVSVFSKDDKTPIKSIHFRGEKGVSWIVAKLLPIDARPGMPRPPIRAGESAQFEGQTLRGNISTWEWDFGDGHNAAGKEVSHTYGQPGTYRVMLTFSDGRHTASVRRDVTVSPPVEARIQPLMAPVMAGKPVRLFADGSIGDVTSYDWDFGDGKTTRGNVVDHIFSEPGIYKVKLSVSDGTYSDDCLAIVRAHTEDTLHLPQVVLDTDQKNEQDDQHYLGYGLFSELDILGVNSIHHGGGQEPINYAEILNIIGLSERSGLPAHRKPFVFRGANKRLDISASRKWSDTMPIISQASDAILAAARGASPSNRVWVVPVGPGTNTASAILQAQAEGLDLRDRVRIMWLGGSNNEIINEFNGNNDPWSMYVVTQSPLETWIMPAPVGARVRIDKRTEADLYADNPLGQYLRKIVPARSKPLFDPSCLSAIISRRLNLGWIKETEPVTVAGPDDGYRWSKTERPTNVRVIRQIDQEAMKLDIFNTMKGNKRRLIGTPVR
ncbi:MAG: PKD domain-containing protein [Phycisphaerales bacterium]|nr:MAG: PKD domain-containing protein [Phycisphaerales bacterium]